MTAPLLFRTALLALAIFGFVSLRAMAGEDKNFNGHYELADKKLSRSFDFEVKQKPKDDHVIISFSAAMTDGTGSAPDADGKGHVDDDILIFKFKDSFKNEGTGTLQLKKNGYHLTLTVTKIVDPAPLHFYGSMVLKPSR